MGAMKYLTLLSLGIASLAVGEQTAEPAATDRPNIVLIMSDDMGWGDVSYHGSTIKTPNIDRIGKEGAELDRFYVFPICSPTRTALMTGRSPIRFGILSPLGGRGGVPKEESFFPQSLQKAGYQTFMVGKWHLGRGEGYEPLDRGFDHFYGFMGGGIDYYKHTSGRGTDWQRNGKTIEEEGYSTDLFAKEAIKLLKERDKEKPLFLYLPFNAPHTPFQAPDAFLEDYETQGFDSRNAARAGAITAMDAAIGKVLEALDEEEMTQNTIVLFFCDNGAGGSSDRRNRGRRREAGGNHPDIGNTPLKSGKGSVYEGGIRVPAVIRWPGVISPGTKVDTVVSVLDVFPTLADAVRMPLESVKPLDGVTRWPVMEKKNKKMEARPPLVIASRGTKAVIEYPWKLVQDRGKTYLYDIGKDPSEKRDLSKEHPNHLERLKKRLAPFETMLKEAASGSERRRGPRGRRGRSTSRTR